MQAEFGFEVCRLCLSPETGGKLSSLFHQPGHKDEVFEIIGDIAFQKDRGKREVLVCQQCVLQVDDAFEFRMEIIHSELLYFRPRREVKDDGSLMDEDLNLRELTDFGFQVCRSCLTPAHKVKSRTLFKEYSESRTEYAEMLFDITGLNITCDYKIRHGLMCIECIAKMEKFHNLRALMRQNEKYYFQPRRLKLIAEERKAAEKKLKAPELKIKLKSRQKSARAPKVCSKSVNQEKSSKRKQKVGKRKEEKRKSQQPELKVKSKRTRKLPQIPKVNLITLEEPKAEKLKQKFENRLKLMAEERKDAEKKMKAPEFKIKLKSRQKSARAPKVYSKSTKLEKNKPKVKKLKEVKVKLQEPAMKIKCKKKAKEMHVTSIVQPLKRPTSQDLNAEKTTKKKFKCEVCQKLLCSLDKLRYHLNSVHAKIRRFFCDICGHSCYLKQALGSHMIHFHINPKVNPKPFYDKNRPFKCNVRNCSKAYKLKVELERHQKAHSDFRPFLCWCEKRFKFKGQLKAHQERVHAGATSKKSRK